MTEHTINVAQEFTPYPAGRFRRHGKFTGEVFRDDILIPALNAYDVVKIDFNGTEGVRSSFLDEAFGGLIRIAHLSADKVRRIFIVPDERSTALEVESYISQELREYSSAKSTR
jgi:STAS-like domain of unknown function (DUF4325)